MQLGCEFLYFGYKIAWISKGSITADEGNQKHITMKKKIVILYTINLKTFSSLYTYFFRNWNYVSVKKVLFQNNFQRNYYISI